jgi:tol-pal system protein YbgF
MRSGFATISVCLVLFLSACADTYTFMPTRTSAPPSAPGQTTGPPPAAPAPMLQERLRALEDRLRNLEGRVAELEQGLPGAAAPVPEASAAPEAAEPLSAKPEYPPAPEVEDKTFNEAMRLYRGQNYEAARQKFYQYLKNRPHGSKAPEARYYLADSFYHDKRYQEAAVEFNKLVNLHPANVLAPSALLRQALSYEQLQQQTNYQISLKKLAQNYPSSPEAQEARKRLGSAR